MYDFNSIDWRPARHQGIFVNVLRRDEQSRDATVLIRMQPGYGYPAHRHVVLEEVFILQGGYRDQEGERRAGEYILNDAGSAHAPVALEGEDCIMLAVAHGGIELLR
jgi:anti-sigma factor ChrR (cupin superfamily)